jgi:hypothetical protein
MMTLPLTCAKSAWSAVVFKEYQALHNKVLGGVQIPALLALPHLALSYITTRISVGQATRKKRLEICGLGHS